MSMLRISKVLFSSLLAVLAVAALVPVHMGAWPRSAAAGTPNWSTNVSAAEFLKLATADNTVVVDIRLLTEQPRQITLRDLIVIRVPWPNGTANPRPGQNQIPDCVRVWIWKFWFAL